MVSADLLATRFREGDRLLSDGAYRSRETTQAWVVVCACRSPLRMMDVQARLLDTPGGRNAARRFREMCARYTVLAGARRQVVKSDADGAV
ncbi:hypothetical protein CKO28_00360 [Rhodovibrio sodomensis]|uniref:Uncharacterized protein n=1 Tax=Rhodovibrio sodomensis TaxID=1088 RepID=A0ABS1D7U8_9PROT|nr:hypothetical protein [Rhodovibrio sodomensis]